jgi:hypothetical protein
MKLHALAAIMDPNRTMTLILGYFCNSHNIGYGTTLADPVLRLDETPQKILLYLAEHRGA